MATGRKLLFFLEFSGRDVVVLAVLVVKLVVVLTTVSVAVDETSPFPLSVESSGGAVHISAWSPHMLPRIFVVLFSPSRQLSG